MATSIQNTRMLLRRTISSFYRSDCCTRNVWTCSVRRSQNEDDSKAPEKKEKRKQLTPEEKAAKQQEAKAKLNLLLESMNKEPQKVYSTESKLSLATPRIKPKTPKSQALSKKVEPEMLKAVEKVSSSFTKDNEELKQKLIDKLEEVADESEKSRLQPFKPDKKKTDDLNSLLNTLKVDIKKPRRAPEPNLAPLKVEKLYSAKPSGIFQNAKFGSESTPISTMKTWDMLYRKELELSVTHPPANGFQQMILWTKQGKLWRFPIDNEQGLEEEAKVGFHEHVFLQPHLEPWCPRRGPVRHFMELVITGLSKNPYLTVAQKKEHISWFREFFDSRRSILIETGAIPDAPTAPSLSA